MNNFSIGILCVIATFLACLVLSYATLKLLKPKKPQKRQAKPKEAVYYVTEKPVKPKPKTVAIKGTLLSEAQLEELMGKRQ